MEVKILKRDVDKVTKKILLEKGLDFSHYKLPFLVRRISRRLQFNNLSNVDDYLKMLQHHHSEYQKLIEDLVIQVSEFFRDPLVFEYLDQVIIPQIIETAAKKDNKTIKIWCPGCAYGEEVLSVVILFLEHLGPDFKKANLIIYGTDISDNALKIARSNHFSEKQLMNLSPLLKEKYFVPTKKGYKIIPEVRQRVKLGHHDLVMDPPIVKTQLLLCRNVCIYWDRELQEQVFDKFTHALEEGGYLVLGKAESLTEDIRSYFKTINSKLKVFQKI